MEECRYTKEELMKSEKFKKRVDLINALLSESEEYTISETEEIIEDFMKGRV